MPLILDATTQNISTTTGDTGTYTWDNIFAMGSTKITKTGNVFFCTAQINLVLTSTLNITNHNIEISGTSFINGTIHINTSRIIVSTQYTQANRFISIGRAGTITDSTIVLRATDQFASMSLDFNTYTNSHIFGENFSSAGGSVSRKINVLTGNSKNIYIKRVTEITLTNVNSKVENLSLFDVNDGIVNFNTMQLLNVFNYSTLGTTRLHYKIGQGSFRFINSPDVILSKGGILNPTAPDFNWGGTTPTAFQAVAHYIRLIDSVGGIVGANVSYSGYSAINLTSTANGAVAEIILDIENTNAQSNINSFGQNSSGTVTALTTVSTPNYTRTIKSYGHSPLVESFVLSKTSSIGSSTSPVSVVLLVDEGVTQSNTTLVAAYTGITHTANTITVTEARTLNEIYDSRKLYWRNNSSIDLPYKDGNVLNLLNTNLVVNGVILIPSTKYKSIKTNGTITYLNNGNTTFSTIDVNGIRFRIYGLPINNNPIIRIKNLATNALSYPTISNGEAYVTLNNDTSYEFRADAVGYLASDFITINTSTVTELQINLLEFRDNSNNSIYGQGVLAEKNLVNYDTSTATITITYSATNPSISLYSIFDKIEETLATVNGLEVTAYPVYNNNRLVFNRDILTSNQNNIKIKPDINNTSDPELLFELVREGDEKPYNLFDFSNSNGRVIRYPTTVNVAQFDGNISVDNSAVATAVWSNTTRTLTSSSTLTTEQEAKLNNLDVAVSTRLAATSYLQAPTTAQIKTEIESSTVLAKEVTVASRASQSSVNLIPTNTLLTTDNRLNNLDTTISSRATLNQIETSSVLAKETTLNTKASQTSVNAIPINPLLTNDNRLNNLDTAISTRLASSDYIEAPTVTDIRTELSTELSRIDATVSSRATSANVWTNTTRSLTEGVTVNTNNDKTDYSLSTNSINAIWNTLITSLSTIGSIGKRIVDYLDTTITSRSSEDTVNTINTKVTTIPTNPLLTTDVRLNTLDANISTRLATSTYIVPLTANDTTDLILNALNTKDVVTVNNLTTTKTELINAITLSGLTEEQSNKLNEISITVLKLKKLRGLVTGVNVIAKAPTNNETGYLRTSDNDINLIITKNGNEEVLSD